MRLIDSCYVIAEAQRFRGKFKSDLEKGVVDLFINMMDCMPTIDAVPVVRCKDCEWYELDVGVCWYWEAKRNICGYCSHGERRCEE